MPSDVPHPRGGKFRSKAQQRYWFATRGEKAGREVARNTAPRGYKGDHPINASRIPERVGKAAGNGVTVGKRLTTDDVAKAGVWVNPLHGTPESRRALLAAGRAAEQHAFKTAKPKPFVKKPKVYRVDGPNTTVGKGITRQGVAPVLARVAPMAATAARPKSLLARPTRAVIGKGGVGEGLRAFRAATGAGRAGLKAKEALPSSRLVGVNRNVVRAGEKTGQGLKLASEHPGATIGAGVVTGSVMGAGLRGNDVNKAYGDPEDARYYRLGMGSAALGGAGAAGLGYAARDVRASSRLARQGSPMGVHNIKNRMLFSLDADEVKAATGTNKKVEGKVLNPRMVHTADRLARNGLAITRRGALAGAGGLAALGGAEALRRRAHERRYN